MMEVVILVAGFALLIKGADWLVVGASSLAKRLNISDLVIGLTVVAFGTSTPELFVNVLAATQGNPQIAIGNILGSNIANVLLILGCSAIIFPLSVKKNTVWTEIPYSLWAAIVLLGLVADNYFGKENNFISRLDGVVLLIFFALFMAYVIRAAIKDKESVLEDLPPTEASWQKALGKVLVGLVGLALGGKFVVDSAVILAKSIGVSESLIGLTVVAVGTSLPEMATSIVAAFKRNADIAVGNVVGSNIFNIFFILGLTAMIKPLPFLSSSYFDVGMCILSSFFLFASMFFGIKHKIGRVEGFAFVGIYIAYVLYLIR